MLVAEIHGKRCPVARDNEDYLTSAVFGHLRYVPPAVFWDGLISHARGLPGQDGTESSLFARLTGIAVLPSSYERLAVHFWPNHPIHGEPDLMLVFSGNGQPSLVLLIEAKLWAGKSGTGEFDQLARYLRVLDDLGNIGVHVPAHAPRYLLYLTPRESQAEVEESVSVADRPADDRARVFRLRWQDVLLAARLAAPHAPAPAGMILADVSGFLSRLGLEYFGGFRQLEHLPALTVRDGRFYNPDQLRPRGVFAGFIRVPGLGTIGTVRGGWVP